MTPIVRTVMTISGCALLAAPSGAQAIPGRISLNAPGEEHRKLEVLAGTWDVTLSLPAGPGRHVEGTATCRGAWTLDGRFLRQEYTSTFNDKPLTVVRYLGFDRHRGVYVEIQFESTHTDVLVGEGTLSADGRTFTASGRHVDAVSGEIVPVRTVTTIEDDDTFRVEMFYASASGADTRTITLRHRRRPARP